MTGMCVSLAEATCICVQLICASISVCMHVRLSVTHASVVCGYLCKLCKYVCVHGVCVYIKATVAKESDI